MHRPVREDEPSARGQRAGADRLHGVVAAEEELQRVLGLDVSEKCLRSVYGGGAAAGVLRAYSRVHLGSSRDALHRPRTCLRLW